MKWNKLSSYNIKTFKINGISLKINHLGLISFYSLLSLSLNASTSGECTLNGKVVNLNNGNDTEGKTGLVVCKDERGSVVREIEYKKGKQVGRELMTQYDGSKKIRTVNEAGNSIGKVQVIGANGKLISEETYVATENGGMTKRQGLVRYFYPDSGKLKDMDWYQDDSSVFHASYGPNGKLSELKCGPKSYTKEDRTLCGFDGKPVTVKTFHSNGGAAQETVYENGKIQEQQTFSPEGNLTHKETFTGDKHKLVTFFPDGKTKMESLYKNYKLDGKEQEFFPEGKISRITTYQEDEIIAEELYFINGNKKSALTNKLTTLGKETTKDLYWDTGSLQSSEKLFKKHQSYEVPVGEHKTYYENGKVYSIQNYNDKGEREGITQFHDDKTGKLLVEDNYKNDKLVAHKAWDKNGKLVEDEEYFADGSQKLKKSK